MTNWHLSLFLKHCPHIFYIISVYTIAIYNFETSNVMRKLKSHLIISARNVWYANSRETRQAYFLSLSLHNQYSHLDVGRHVIASFFLSLSFYLYLSIHIYISNSSSRFSTIIDSLECACVGGVGGWGAGGGYQRGRPKVPPRPLRDTPVASGERPIASRGRRDDEESTGCRDRDKQAATDREKRERENGARWQRARRCVPRFLRCIVCGAVSAVRRGAKLKGPFTPCRTGQRVASPRLVSRFRWWRKWRRLPMTVW